MRVGVKMMLKREIDLTTSKIREETRKKIDLETGEKTKLT